MSTHIAGYREGGVLCSREQERLRDHRAEVPDHARVDPGDRAARRAALLQLILSIEHLAAVDLGIDSGAFQPSSYTLIW
jgi:hypothetical protein